MAARNTLLNGTVSFAHLHGITRPLGGKAEAPDDDKKQGPDESDDDYAKRMEESDIEDEKKQGADESDDDYAKRMEDGDDENGDGEKKPVEEKSKAAHSNGVKSERRRWAAVLGHKSFAGNPALGARLLATTGLSASTITGCLRESPAASSGSTGRAAGNPQIGPNGATTSTSKAPTTQRWGAAFERAGIK